jgi:prepilin peptidase dependent protein B
MEARAAQRGVSVVELLVGIAIGLLIVAAGTALLVANLRETRHVLLEARLMQDLRSAADLVARDLRRAGHWADADDGIWLSNEGPPSTNPYAAAEPDTGPAEGVTYRYERGATGPSGLAASEQFGFRLHNDAIEMQLGAANWQALTDSATLTVTRLTVTPITQSFSLASFCLAPCPGDRADCPPRQQVRTYAIGIEAHLVADRSVVHRLHTWVRLRNDAAIGRCAG